MGDIHNVSELSIDSGHTYDPVANKLSVQDNIGLYIKPSLHALTDILAATDCFKLAGTLLGPTGLEQVGGAVATGVSVTDGCGVDTPGLTLRGLFGVTDPLDSTPAVKIIGGKRNGTTNDYKSLAASERVFSVYNAATECVNVFGNGDFANVQWTSLATWSTIIGWSSFSGGVKEIYYKKIGNIVFCSFFLKGTSNSGDVSFTLPYSALTSYQVLGESFNQDNTTAFTVGRITNGNGVVYISKDLNGTLSTWTASNEKSVNGSFWFESTAIV